jgi:hypothetical protein
VLKALTFICFAQIVRRFLGRIVEKNKYRRKQCSYFELPAATTPTAELCKQCSSSSGNINQLGINQFIMKRLLMKSTKKVKSRAIKLPVTHTWTKKAAMDAADLPETDNPFVTRTRLSNVMNALTEGLYYELQYNRREMITSIYVLNT